MNDELKLIHQKMLVLTGDYDEVGPHHPTLGPHALAVGLLIEAIRAVARRQGCMTSFLLDEIAVTYANVPRWYE